MYYVSTLVIMLELLYFKYFRLVLFRMIYVLKCLRNYHYHRRRSHRQYHYYNK